MWFNNSFGSFLLGFMRIWAFISVLDLIKTIFKRAPFGIGLATIFILCYLFGIRPQPKADVDSGVWNIHRVLISGVSCTQYSLSGDLDVRGRDFYWTQPNGFHQYIFMRKIPGRVHQTWGMNTLEGSLTKNSFEGQERFHGCIFSVHASLLSS